MKASARNVVIFSCSLALLVSCSKINLHGGGKSANPTAAASSTGSGLLSGGPQGGQPTTIIAQPTGGGPPPVDGEWEFDYEFKGNPFIGNVTLSQQGSALDGQGADQDGKEWIVDAGQINGTKISFGKKYASSSGPPISYTGELKYLQTPEYTGWAMEGTYSAVGPDGKTVTGKWVANPTSQVAAESAASTAPEQGGGNPFAGGQPPPPRTSQPEHIGDAHPADISGHYDGTYNFNFKRIKWKMWIESDGKKVTGRGYDVGAPAAAKAKGKDKGKEAADSNEHFTIARGWYEYPKVTLVRQYTKGKGARESRAVTFRGQLSSNGRDIVMKGETQFGGSWDAHRL